MTFIEEIKKRARKLNKIILLPESTDERVIKAIEIIQNDQTITPALIGNRIDAEKLAKKIGANIKWSKVKFFDPKNKSLLKKYATELYEIRKAKGLTLSDAQKLVEDINYFAVITLHLNKVDGIVSGATGSTAETVRPALQIIKTKEKFHKVSSIFFMVLEKRTLLFADCAINIEPDAHELADIAIDTAETAKRFGIKPRIAMLSFSTNGSAKHPKVDKVHEAVQMIKYRKPKLIVDGEMQVDAALIPEISVRKFPNSTVKGDANILIFPDLQSGNIAYKLVERLAHAKAIGPILQGLQKPVNDLSRGCSAQDIADLAAFTACESVETKYKISHK